MDPAVDLAEGRDVVPGSGGQGAEEELAVVFWRLVVFNTKSRGYQQNKVRITSEKSSGNDFMSEIKFQLAFSRRRSGFCYGKNVREVL